MTIPEEKIKEIAKCVADGMDMKSLMVYAEEQLAKYFSSLDDELFKTEWFDYYGKEYPNKSE